VEHHPHQQYDRHHPTGLPRQRNERIVFGDERFVRQFVDHHDDEIRALSSL